MTRENKFWANQPVSVGTGNEPISIPKSVSNKASPLPEGFTFGDLQDYYELASFLEENYVEDVHGTHLLSYSPEFIERMLITPNNRPEYSLCLRWNGNLVGYAFAKEHMLSIREKKAGIVSVNFLCVAKELRGRRIAPVMIKEITRRVNLRGIYSALFTGGNDLFFNLCTTRYFHRPLNAKRLMELGFGDNIVQMPIPTPRKTTRLMTKEDVPLMTELFQTESRRYSLHEEMASDEIEHCFLPQEGVMYTYINVDDKNTPTFGSFYIIDTVEKKSKLKIKAAYLYYRSSEGLADMISDLIGYAHMAGCDVFNALTVMNNFDFFSDLGFEEGNGTLKYYLYNWRTDAIKSTDVGFLLF